MTTKRLYLRFDWKRWRTVAPLAAALGVAACGGTTGENAGDSSGTGARAAASGSTGSVASSTGAGGASGGTSSSGTGEPAESGASSGTSSSGAGGSAGSSTTGTTSGAGGEAGAGGSGQGGSPQCYAEPGVLVPEAKGCETSADCTFVPTYSCCGPGLVVGLAKAKPEYTSCFTTSYPQDCPPLGCSSSAVTEDGLSPEGGDAGGVLARCQDTEAGSRQCMTTTCQDGMSCTEGETCQNGCGRPCSCEAGLMLCEYPELGTPCATMPGYCSYDPMGAPQQCWCAADGWQCNSLELDSP